MASERRRGPVTVEYLLSRAMRVDGCLIWQGRLNEHGYGQVDFEGKGVQCADVAKRCEDRR